MKNRHKSLADAKKKEESLLKQVDEAKEKLNEAARLVKEAATKEKEFDVQPTSRQAIERTLSVDDKEQTKSQQIQ